MTTWWLDKRVKAYVASETPVDSPQKLGNDLKSLNDDLDTINEKDEKGPLDNEYIILDDNKEKLTNNC